MLDCVESGTAAPTALCNCRLSITKHTRPHCLPCSPQPKRYICVNPAAPIKWGLDSVTFWEVFSRLHLTWPSSYYVYSSFCLVKDSWLNWIKSEDLFITAGWHYRQDLIKRTFSQVDEILYLILNWTLMENREILLDLVLWTVNILIGFYSGWQWFAL